MVKHKEEEKVNQPKGAITESDVNSNTPVDRETASHLYQDESPAVVTNALSGYEQKNIISDMAAAEAAKKEVKKEKKEKLSDAEYERRTKLDVSNPDYINPSQDY